MIEIPTTATTATGRARGTDAPVRRGALPAANKVAEVGVLFWVIKILTTGMGEVTSDWALRRGEGLPGIGIALTLSGIVLLLVATLVLQLRARRYVPEIYWSAIVAVSIFGTVAADVVHFGFGVPLWLLSTLYALALAVNFALWYRSERTLSIHGITSRRRETYYWVTVFFTFALGTASGDLTALGWNLGFLLSGILFLAVIAIPAVAHLRFGVNAVLTFWCAYVVTRPLGASFADWFAASGDGLGWGAGRVALVMTIVIVALVGHAGRVQRARA